MSSMSSTVARPRTTVSTTAARPFPCLVADRPATTCRSIVLDGGNVLRIHDGRGLRVTSASGVLWITEEESTSDTVLVRGGTHRITRPGLTLVLAHGSSVALLETPAGAAPPRRIDFAHADGAPGRRLAWGIPGRLDLGAWATAARRLVRDALSLMPSTTKGLRAAPAEDRELAHDDVHPARLLRDPRHALDSEEFLPRKARNAISRDLLFPYY